MKKRLFNQQSEPGSREAATAQRLSVKARIMMALFALMLIPQGTWAQSPYPVYIGSEQLTSANIGNYPGMSYSPDTQVLTLDNTTLTSTISWSDFNSDLCIRLKGSNSITISGATKSCIDCGYSNASTIYSRVLFEKGDDDCELILQCPDGANLIDGFSAINYEGVRRVSLSEGKNAGDPNKASIEAVYLSVAGRAVSKSSFAGSATSCNITGTNITSGTVTYDKSTSELTLNNAEISYSSGDAIVYERGDMDLNVKLVGLSTIDCGGNYAFNGNTSHDMKFTTTAADAGGLVLASTRNPFDTQSYYSGFNQVIAGSGLFGGYSVGSPNKVEIFYNYNLWVAGTQVKSTNVNDVLSNGGKVSYDVATNKLTLDGVTLSGAIVTYYGNLNIHIKNNCSISSPANCIRTGTYAGTLTFTKEGNGKLELNSTTRHSVIKGFPSLAGVPIETKEPYALCTTDDYHMMKLLVYENDTTGIDYAIIDDNTTYPLWVNSKQVTSKNSSNVLNSTDATPPVVFKSGTNTLELNKAVFTGRIVSSLGNLILNVSGSNKITSPDTSTIVRSVNAGTLTIVKNTDDAALELLVNGNDNHPVIQGFHSLVYTGFDMNTPASSPKYDIFSVGTPNGDRNIYGLFDPAATYSAAIKSATFATNYDLWVNGTRVTSANASNIGPSGTDFSFDPTESTLHYRSGGGTSYPILSGLPNLTIKIGSPDNGDYSKNNISIIKFGAPTGVTIAATSGNLTLSKEDGVTGVQQFDIVAYGSEILIQGFDNVTYSDFVILQDGATYNTTNKQLEYPNPSGSGFVGYGGISATFVTPQDISNYYVADIANKDYTGSALAPAITVMETAASATSLVENTDYTVSYKLSGAVTTPIDANTYNVIIDGKGRYTGSITTKTFTIDPIAVTLSWSGTSFTFDGDAHKPTATATGLIGSDVCNVTVTGEQTNASATAYTATATALDNNNYKLPAAVTQTFTITPCSLASARIDDISAQTYTYSGSEIMPTPGVGIKLGKSTTETPLSAGTDFEYTYANNKNAAKANDNLPPTVTITGKGNYNGTRVVKFTIDQVDMSTSTDITIEAVPDQTYTGSAITPTPTVKFKGNDLVAGTGNDFVYSYLNNTNAALSTDPTAPPTVTITGSGNFKNSTSVKFTILDRTASVTFGSGRTYMTFCDPSETFLVPDGVKAYIVTAVSGSTVTIKQVSYIPKNVPVLLESTSSTYTNTKDPNDTFTGNMLSFAAAAVTTDGNQYVLYSDEFVKATGTIPVGRVYLAYSSPVRRLTIDRNNSATAIEAIVEEAADSEQWYDMQGRKINKPTKAGLYIKNGKKVVVNNK